MMMQQADWQDPLALDFHDAALETRVAVAVDLVPPWCVRGAIYCDATQPGWRRAFAWFERASLQ